MACCCTQEDLCNKEPEQLILAAGGNLIEMHRNLTSPSPPPSAAMKEGEIKGEKYS
jgi:hypothetical protein